MLSPLRVAFVTNFCPHYRVGAFELIAQHYQTDFYFFSAGNEWYWQQQNGLRAGRFDYEYLPGFYLGRTRVTLSLPGKLLSRKYDVYIKCINGRFALPITFVVSRLRRRPFILWTGIWMRLGTPVHRTFFRLTRYIYQHADAVVVYGAHVKRYLVGEGVPAEKVFLAPQAVDNRFCGRLVPEEAKAAIRERLGIGRDQRMILFVGRLEEGKGVCVLVEAFASLRRRDSVLVLAGAGSQQSQLQDLAAANGVADRVIFAGHVATDETAAYYSIAWVCVLPSITTPAFKEPWGLVVNEAFNQGTPVIVTEAVGAAAGGLVLDGVNGLVVPEGNMPALADALRRILDEASLRSQLARSAARAISSWDYEHMAQGFRDAVDFVVNRSSRRKGDS